MEIKVKTTCPLGSECEEIKGDYIHRCAWNIKIIGKDPQSGKEVDEWRCAMAWIPVLTIEGNGISNGVAASVQSLRNETIKRQDIALGQIKTLEVK